MKVIERAQMLFKRDAKQGQPFLPGDSVRLLAQAVDEELAARDRRISDLERKLDRLATTGPGDVA